MIVELVALATLARQPMPSPVEPPTTHAELPRTFDEALEEAPTTTAPAATETPSAVAPASSPTLPHTGLDLTYLAAAGAFTAAGALTVGGVACRNRKDIRP